MPLSGAQTRSPVSDGIYGVSVGFFATTFDLDIPTGYDIPLHIVFTNASVLVSANATVPAYRVQLFINGWQFGKYGKRGS